MRIARSILAVAAGFAAFYVIVRVLTVFEGSLQAGGTVMNYLVLSLSWTVAGAVISGYIAARVAGAHEFPHAAALGLLMIVVSVVSMRQQGIGEPGWYQTTIAGCGPISAMLGAAIRLLMKQSSQTANRNTSAPASRR